MFKNQSASQNLLVHKQFSRASNSRARDFSFMFQTEQSTSQNDSHAYIISVHVTSLLSSKPRKRKPGQLSCVSGSRARTSRCSFKPRWMSAEIVIVHKQLIPVRVISLFYFSKREKCKARHHACVNDSVRKFSLFDFKKNKMQARAQTIPVRVTSVSSFKPRKV